MPVHLKKQTHLSVFISGFRQVKSFPCGDPELMELPPESITVMLDWKQFKAVFGSAVGSLDGDGHSCLVIG